MSTPPRRITWTLFAKFADGSGCLLDIIEWEPGYNSTAKEAWKYMWGVFRAQMRDPGAYDAVSIYLETSGR